MRIPASLALVLVLPVGPLSAESASGLDAHAHGAASLEVAFEGGSLAMRLELPGEDVVGFEHAAETDEQRARVEAERERLADPMALFAFGEGAGCAVASSEVELHREGDHNAFEAEYALACTDPTAIAEIRTMLFEIYPSLEEIDVEFATAGGQGGGEMTPGAPLLALPGTS